MIETARSSWIPREKLRVAMSLEPVRRPMGADQRVPMCSAGRASRPCIGRPERLVLIVTHQHYAGAQGGGPTRFRVGLPGLGQDRLCGRSPGAEPALEDRRPPLYIAPAREGSGLLGRITSGPEAFAAVRHLHGDPACKRPRRYRIEGSRPRAGRPGCDERIPPPRLGYRVRPVYSPGRFINGLRASPLSGAA